MLAKARAFLAANWPTLARDGAGIAGLASIAYGFWGVFHPLGFIVLGIELVGAVALAERARLGATPK
jgi:hypothetical protein